MRVKIVYLVILLFSVMLLFSCDKEKNTSTNKSDENVDVVVPQSKEEVSTKRAGEESKDFNKQKLEESKNEDIKVSERLVVKSGNITLEIENYDEAMNKISEITNNYKGYIASSNTKVVAWGKKQGIITIRVPADKFEALFSEISGIGKLISENITTNDITEEYIDLEARQKTQKQLEERLLKLLSERTAYLSDILAVEDKLSSVRQKIESVEGKMKYLKSQAAYSTLTISLNEPNLLDSSSGNGGFFYELGQAIKTGLKGLMKVLIFLITAIIVLIPFIVIALIVIFIIKKRRKKESTSKQN